MLNEQYVYLWINEDNFISSIFKNQNQIMLMFGLFCNNYCYQYIDIDAHR